MQDWHVNSQTLFIENSRTVTVTVAIEYKLCYVSYCHTQMNVMDYMSCSFQNLLESCPG